VGLFHFLLTRSRQHPRCDLFFGGGVHECKTKAVTMPRWRLFLCQPGEPLHGLCRQIGTGGLRCPVLTQRRLALFSSAALCVWRVNPTIDLVVVVASGILLMGFACAFAALLIR
jgi:hypothetical protein